MSRQTNHSLHLFSLLFVIAGIFGISTVASAQIDEQRFKIELTVHADGATAKTLLNSSSISFARQDPYLSADSIKAAADSKPEAASSPREIYLSMDANSISKELMQILAKKTGPVKGTIIVTDAYNQSQVRNISFGNAVLGNYSDQISSYGYNGKPGNVAFSFICKELQVDGIAVAP